MLAQMVPSQSNLRGEKHTLLGGVDYFLEGRKDGRKEGNARHPTHQARPSRQLLAAAKSESPAAKPGSGSPASPSTAEADEKKTRKSRLSLMRAAPSDRFSAPTTCDE